MITAAFHIESDSVKLVTAKSNFTNLEFLSFDSEPLAPGKKSDISGAIKSLCSRNVINASRIIATLPSEKVIIKTVSLPFTDERKIAEIIPIEAEENIPIDIDKITLVHQILSKSKEGSNIIIAACRTDYLEEFKNFFVNAGLNISAVYLEYNALFALYKFSNSNAHEASQIDFGKDRIIINKINHGKLSETKTLAKGYSDFSKIFTDEKISSLETAKIISSSADNKSSADTKKSKKNNYAPLFEKYETAATKTAKNIFAFIKPKGEEKILFSGVNLFAQNFAGILFKELEIPVYDFSAVNIIKNFKEQNCEIPCGTLICDQNPSSQPDFLSHKEKKSEVFNNIKPGLFMIGSALLIFVLYFIISSIVLVSKGNGSGEILKQQFKQQFRQEAKTSDVIAEAKAMLENEKKQISSLSAVLPEKKSVLLNLEEALRFFSSDPAFSLKDITLNQNQININGEISDLSKIDDFKNKLNKSGKYSSVDLNTSYSGKTGVKFTLSIKLKGAAGKK
ncbi:MAG TPA: pilus assembly protein PilM [Spirochaetota bacterium]|nr:pilus assembly protein PilM [Spirochaetota bacterium]